MTYHFSLTALVLFENIGKKALFADFVRKFCLMSYTEASDWFEKTTLRVYDDSKIASTPNATKSFIVSVSTWAFTLNIFCVVLTA